MYTDLAEALVLEGHQVTVMAPAGDGEARMAEEGGVRVVRVRSPHLAGTGKYFVKGIRLALLPFFYKRAFRIFLKGETFDWILMPTPSVTLAGFIGYAKKRTGAGLYLILRDIHPQSAKCMGMLKFRFMYRYLDRKARKAYMLSDIIGCQSPLSASYLCEIAPYIDRERIKMLDNWLKFERYTPPADDIREKYGLGSKYIALFGGNLGPVQKPENILALADHYRHNEDILFLVVARGAGGREIRGRAETAKLGNIRVMDFMPRKDYNELLKTADVGIISLDERHIVPTCPSKILGYMSMKIPVVAMISPGGDYGAHYLYRALRHRPVGSRERPRKRLRELRQAVCRFRVT